MGYAKKRPIGSYDGNILCAVCDNKIGIYDEYAKVFVTTAKLVTHPSGAGWTVDNVDQHKLKMFCVSYIWRASITSLAEFRGTSLGTLHEEKMREMILKDDSGTPYDYTASIQKFESADGKFGGILFPARTKVNDVNHYEAYLPNGYKIWVKVDSRNEDVITPLSIGALDPMFVGNRGDYHASTEKGIMVNAVRRSSW